MNSGFPQRHGRRSSGRSYASIIWSLIKISAFLAVIGFAVWLFIRQTVHDRLSGLVESKINEQLTAKGLKATVGDAQLFAGKGIRLGNVAVEMDRSNLALNPTRNQLSATPPERSRLEVYELFAHLDANLAALATQKDISARAIEFKRAKLTLVRTADGEWDFEPVMEALMIAEPEPQKEVPIVLTDCEIRIVDLSRPGRSPVTVSGINFTIHNREHAGRKLLQITGGFQTRAVSQIQLTAYVDQENQVWQTELTAKNARLSRELIQLLPPELSHEFDSLKTLVGKVAFNASATGGFSLNELPTFSVSGQLSEFAIDDERLPMAIHKTSAGFTINNNGIAITGAKGEMGDEGQFRGNYSQTGILERGGWHIDGAVTNFRFDERPRMVRWLPSYCRSFCRDYSPLGTCNITFDMTHDGQSLKRKLDGVLTDMSFSFVKMPYRVDHCVGIVNWVDDRCDFDIRSKVGEQPVRLHGFADNIGRQPTFQANMQVPGTLPIDQKMFDAIAAQPKLSNVIRAFDPAGRVGGMGTLERREPGGEVSKTFDIRLVSCEVRHNSFAYPIYNIDGLVEIRNDKYSFKELRGNNSSGIVGCNGTFSPTDGLRLRFLCDAVPLNDQLKFALKPEVREIWSGFRPKGKLDFLKVDMTMLPGKKINLDLEATLRPSSDDPDANYVSIYPVWFPYQINRLTGNIKIADGKISLTDIAGNHQDTWVACKGQGHYSEQSWSLRLEDLLVSSLKVDNDLLAAVPRLLAPPLAQLGYEGLMNVNGEITLAGSTNGSVASFGRDVDQANGQDPFSKYVSKNAGTFEPSPSITPPPKKRTSMAWDLRVNMSQANMQLGVPIKNVFGAVQLTGLYDGKTFNCDGELDIDSLTVFDTQVTKVSGPLRIENDRVLVGVFASENKTEPAVNISPINLSKSGAVYGTLHGGRIELDAQLDTAHQNEFYIEARLKDSCLATACRELAPHLENVEGHSFAEIRLRGNGSGTHSHRGIGNMQLRDARIYELPVFLSLLKILNVRQPSRTAFDSGNIDFSVHGETLVLDRMEFNGDVISLIGNGQINQDLDINLDFYSVMGRNNINIPFITKLIQASSQQVFHINVDGKLNDPQTHRRGLPKLADLKDLFNPGARGNILRDRFVVPASSNVSNGRNSVGQSFFQQANPKPFQSQVRQ